MTSFVTYLLIVIAAEAVTEIIGEAEVFASLRAGLKRLPGFLGWYLGGLFGCRYCLSVWVAFGAAIVYPWAIVPGDGWLTVVANFTVTAFSIHRLSNLAHEILNRLLDKQPFLISLLPRGDVPVESADEAHDENDQKLG